ncbi:MAG: alpha-amylase family glycosyl hydrolase, partial [Macrococcoides caseolyticum]
MKRISIILMILLLSFSALPAQAASQDEMRIYSILTDRFMNGDEDNNKDIHNDKDNNLPYGGDFKGIINKVDYIKKMGFNAIHVSPVFDHEKNDYLGYKINN